MKYILSIASILILLALPSLAVSGTIHIISSVPGVQIELDGTKYQKDILTSAIPVGTHIIRAFYVGETTPFYETTVTIKENESTSVLIKNNASLNESKPVEPTPAELAPVEPAQFVSTVQRPSSPSSNVIIGFNADVKSAAYLSSISGLSSTTTADPMLGLGIVAKKYLGNDLTLVFEGMFNTGSGFTNANGTKTSLQVYPIEINVQKDFGGWYLGAGGNYSLWSMSASTTLSMQNGLGVQFYGGWNDKLGKNSDLEIKYSYMTASANVSGYTLNTALGTLSVGVKYWLD